MNSLFITGSVSKERPEGSRGIFLFTFMNIPKIQWCLKHLILMRIKETTSRLMKLNYLSGKLS